MNSRFKQLLFKKRFASREVLEHEDRPEKIPEAVFPIRVSVDFSYIKRMFKKLFRRV